MTTPNDSPTTGSAIQLLVGHDSAERAYVIADYPYGFRLRCKKKVWIETHPKHGQRVVEQTTNPKIEGREVWNKPKASTYAMIQVLYLDGEGHVHNAQLTAYDTVRDKVEGFLAKYGDACRDDYRGRLIADLLKAIERYEARSVSAGGSVVR